MTNIFDNYFYHLFKTLSFQLQQFTAIDTKNLFKFFFEYSPPAQFYMGESDLCRKVIVLLNIHLRCSNEYMYIHIHI